MQVWQLMSVLSKARANAEVGVGMHATLNADVSCVHVSDDGQEVTITGGDAQLIDEDGNEAGLLSELSAVEGDEDETQ